MIDDSRESVSSSLSAVKFKRRRRLRRPMIEDDDLPALLVAHLEVRAIAESRVEL